MPLQKGARNWKWNSKSGESDLEPSSLLILEGHQEKCILQSIQREILINKSGLRIHPSGFDLDVLQTKCGGGYASETGISARKDARSANTTLSQRGLTENPLKLTCQMIGVGNTCFLTATSCQLGIVDKLQNTCPKSTLGNHNETTDANAGEPDHRDARRSIISRCSFKHWQLRQGLGQPGS